MKNTRKLLAITLALALLLTVCALASGTRAFITTGKVHMRARPDLSSQKVATLPKDTVINATDYEMDYRGVRWYYGSYGNKLGWVSEKYLKPYDGKPLPTPMPTPKPTPKPIDYSAFKDAGYYVSVTGNSVNMRKAPSTDYPVVRAYVKGDRLYAVKTDGSWMEVLDESTGRSGYMSARYLEKCAEPITVYPQEAPIDPASPEDGEYPAAFAKEDLVSADGVLTLNNVHLYTENTYDIVDMAELKIGDTIVIDGEEVLVERIDRKDGVNINGGNLEGGWTLYAWNESNCFTVCGDDDISTYTDHGAANLEIAENVVYSDTADLDNPVEGGYKDLAEAFEAGPDYGYSAYNTRIRIEGGRIVEIDRFYTP